MTSDTVMPRLGVIVASTRDGRVGMPVTRWFLEIARSHGGFDIALIDLKEVDLPILTEPNHPRLRKYTQEKTKSWSATVAACEAFVLVTPEYNHGSPPALVNALDHLSGEWNYKAAGFVSYGGASGGMRSVMMTRQILTTLRMVPVVEAVNISFVAQAMDKDSGSFKGSETLEKAARAMLDEIVRWTTALSSLRA